ncbi:hyaluronan mediated motility receptor-like isoform X2 [Arapaima gigas]
MRRFFQTRSDEHSQVEILVAKCSQLMQEKVLLEKEILMAGEREKSLRMELKNLSACLSQQEKINIQLCLEHQQLLEEKWHQQQQLCSVPDRGSWDTGLLVLKLEQVAAALQQLQASEAQLEQLVDRLQEESLQRAAQLDELQAQLDSRTQELEELRCCHQGAVEQLHREKEGSLRKLQETVEQCAWLCEQQRNWRTCVKRFKECMSEEKEALRQRVGRMEAELMELRNRAESGDLAKSDGQHHTSSGRLANGDPDLTASLRSEVDK